MPRDRWSDWDDFPPSKPIAVEGGLATRKQRGAMADTWWSQRFVDMLESFGLGGRMERGRRYARKGQVISIDVEAGTLWSRVQGSRAEPYVVSIGVPAPTKAQWSMVIDTMAGRVGFVARLLAGEVPPDLETVFADAGVPLFPRTWNDVRADCSCPDFGNPCKHIAAVLYVFADQLDDDPWLLLEWMGRTREELLAPLRGKGGAAAGRVDHGLPPWWPLEPGRDHEGATTALDSALTTAADPPDAVLSRLEPLDVTVRGVPLPELLRTAYEAMQHPVDD
jgi:uncharacterized Zn finger protein